MSLARRYGPFILLAVAQLFVILVAPSRPPTTVSANSGFNGATGLGGDNGSALGSSGTGDGTGAATGAATGGAGTGTGTGTGANGTTGSRGTGTGTGTNGAGGAGLPPGDTTHCVGDRQFVGIANAPACVPKFAGNNGGKTYRGVTANAITIVYYRGKENAAVQAVLQTQGLASTQDEQRAFMEASAKYLNAHYEGYGRKFNFVFFQGTCDTVPPATACLRTEAKSLVTRFNPFAVVWMDNTNVPEFFDELSKNGVVNFGGWHFHDSFMTERRPYHYDAFMGGQFQAEITASYWCTKLKGLPAKYAGDAALRVKKRKAAVVVPEYEYNKKSGQALVDLINKCDPGGAIISSYSSDTTTAESQAIANIAKYRQENVTSILWFSDPVAPAYGSKTSTGQQWYPENILVGSGLLDYDVLGRLYDPDQWKNAFGVSDLTLSKPFEKTDASVVWQAAGNSGLPYSGANLPWSYFNLIGSSIMAAGPNLTPENVERGLLTSKPTGGWAQTGGDQYVYRVEFGKGDYTALSDAREVYWDPNAKSAIDGKAGAYVPLNGGRRYRTGEWLSGEPVFPIK
jgi:hypothetical protein